MPRHPDQIKQALGEYFPKLMERLKEGDDIHTAVDMGLQALDRGALSWARLNQVMHLCSEAGMSEGFFRYYFLCAPSTHPYPVDRVFPDHTFMPMRDARELQSLDHFLWGLRRFLYDAMLYWGNFRQAYRDLRQRSEREIEELFARRQFDENRLLSRGQIASAIPITQDHRYLISEMACKTYEQVNSLRDVGHVQLALEAFRGLRAEGVVVTPRSLRERTEQLAKSTGQLGLFELLYEEPEQPLDSEEDVLGLYAGQWDDFTGARLAALANTRIYLSICSDLDVYVATSMRTRQDFRDMARTCDEIFGAGSLGMYNVRYFDPTLSAAEHHEDKGIIECLMVKTAKVVLYFAQHKESLGKVSEYAMGLSLGKPVVILCPPDAKGDELYRFYQESHPLTRLVEFASGVVNGAMITQKVSDVVVLVERILSNRMEYDLQRKPNTQAYYLLKERLTQSTVRVVTDNAFLTEAFWNNYHGIY